MVSAINKRLQKIEDRLKHKAEIPVLIMESNEEMELLEYGRLPFGVTDRTVVIVDDIGSL